MSYYAIGIGGSGSKCIESLIHLSAAGLMPDNEDLHVLFVDSDRSNGNGTRTSELLRVYQACKSNHIEGGGLFKTSIPSLQNIGDANDANRWSPTQIGESLDNFVGKNRLDDKYSYFFETLYSPIESRTILNEGFRGRPSIGAAVMANAVDLDQTEPWRSLKSLMQADAGQGKTPKIIIFGSIFGGTGAAGFPTISRLLHNWSETFQTNPLEIGGVLLLPYFSFDNNSIADAQLYVESHDFLLNTQAALKYYHQQNFHNLVKVTYLLGADDQSQMPVASVGSATQENPAHWVELCAALAAIDFFSKNNSKSATYRLLGRQSADALLWSDLPHSDIQSKLLQFTRFSFAYLSTYYPILENIESRGKTYRAPWFVDFFEYKGINLRERMGSELRNVKEFCEKFLLWFANVEFYISGSETQASNLINYSSFAEYRFDEPTRSNKLFLRGSIRTDSSFQSNFQLDGFEEILLPDMIREASGLSFLWNNMCNEIPANDNRENAWTFINALYRQCGSI